MKTKNKKTNDQKKKKWLNAVACDMMTIGARMNYMGDQVKWRLRTKVSPNILEKSEEDL